MTAESALRWLATGALDGAVFALIAWLASSCLLRRSSGRVMSWIWLVALAKFVIIWPIELHAMPPSAAALGSGAMRAPVAWLSWLAPVYLGGVATLVLRLLLAQRSLRRRIAALPRAEPELLARVSSAADKLGLALALDVRITEEKVSPFIVGPSSPSLVLPRWLCSDERKLDAVLLHELAHVARRDHWLLYFERVVAALFFFWPPVYWVRRHLGEARELACDERAIQRGGFSAAEYGRHLLDVVAMTQVRVGANNALAIGRASRRLERRIDRLLDEAWSKRKVWREGIALVLLVLFAVVGLRPVREVAAAGPIITACDGSRMSRPIFDKSAPVLECSP